MQKEYIEREPILKDIEEMLNAVRQHINITGRGSGKTLWEGIGRGIIYCSKKLLAAHAADVVEVRHAKWVSSEQYNGRPECPVCFYVTDEKTNYCPHCGAKMDKEE